MPNQAKILKVDGTEEILKGRPTLSEAQTTVGGYIEYVAGRKADGKAVVLVVDEEGKLTGKKKNSQATLLYWRTDKHIGGVIVGDVIILEGWRTVSP